MPSGAEKTSRLGLLMDSLPGADQLTGQAPAAIPPRSEPELEVELERAEPALAPPAAFGTPSRPALHAPPLRALEAAERELVYEEPEPRYPPPGYGKLRTTIELGEEENDWIEDLVVAIRKANGRRRITKTLVMRALIRAAFRLDPQLDARGLTMHDEELLVARFERALREAAA